MPPDPALHRLERHTLVVPTYNRPGLLARLVGHLAGRVPHMPVLILDSSSDADAAERNAHMAARIGGMLRYQRYDAATPMAAKLAQGLAQVDTASVSFCADDDLVFPRALVQALDFLDAHPDHVSAHGLYFNFGEHGHDLHIMGEYAGRSIEGEHPGARLFALMQSYESLFYAVFRTAQITDIFAAVKDIPSLHYQELFQSAAALILGKVARLPIFYVARRSGPAAEPERDRWQTYYWFADDPGEFVAHYLAYRKQLWDFYDRHGARPRLERAAFERVSDICHVIYFAKACPPAYFHSVLQDHWPNDAFDGRTDDIFAELGGSAGQAGMRSSTAGGVEGLLARMQAWLAARRRYRPAPGAQSVLGSLNAQVKAAGGTAWNAKIVNELGWLAGNDDFRTCYLDLCAYLDEADAMT